MTRRSRTRALLVAAALAVLNAAPARPQTQTFRSGASLVRVDVYPTAGGHPVADLQASDFEVLEDDVPQKIEAFEHVLIQPAVQPQTTATPATTNGQAAANADGRSRIFVLFLDTYFTDLGGSRRARAALANVLDRLIGPDDLIGVMTPDMAASDVTLVHRAASVEDMLSKYWFWGQRDTEVVDPVEDQYLTCYPRNQFDTESGLEKYAGVADEMIQRRREKRVIDALGDLTKHLRTVSDARKAVITVTDGWVLFKPNLEMTERGRYHQARPGVGHDGRLTTNVNADSDGLSTQRCEQDRVSLALVDDKASYDTLIDAANRSNVSFYPVSVDGLRAFDHDLSTGSGEALSGERQAAAGPTLQTPSEIGPLRLATDRAVLGRRVDSLQSLAVNTDGLAITGASDIDTGLHRIVDDLSSYYLLGYSSTNPLPDGKFRKIRVRVLRSGVDVRARRGYRAPTREELARPDVPAGTARAPKSPVEAAMAELKAERQGSPLRVGAAYAPLGPADAGGDRVHIWAMAEIDPVIARRGEWIGGGTVELSVTARDGETLARKSVTFAGGEHSASVDLGEVTAAAGEAVVHATARAAGGGRENYAEALHLDSLGVPGRPLIYRRGPQTALKYLPSASREFDRTERIRVDLPLGAAPASPAAELLDRAGNPVSIPVAVTMRTGDGLNWVTADLTLAPLAAGAYFIRLKPDVAHPEANVVAGFRVVP